MLTLFLGIALGFAVQPVPTDGAPRISQDDFKKLRAQKNVIIVDTRNEDAYRRGHIPGAILLPLEGQPSWPAEYEKTVEMLKAARKPIVTYCA
jgi:rhodanese-related sulfurtransferase